LVHDVGDITRAVHCRVVFVELNKHTLVELLKGIISLFSL
jgi:hypothetical protein